MAKPRTPEPQTPQPDSISISRWSGLRNTLTPERLAQGELARGQNIDLDDAGQPHRRRGCTLVAAGAYHSLFNTAKGTPLGVCNGVLGRINPDFSFSAIATVGAGPFDYVQVGDVVYFSSDTYSGQLNLKNAQVTPWGMAVGESFDWPTTPTPAGFWFSPVVDPSDTLGAVGGRLFQAPPLASVLGYFHGRIYLGKGKTLWATELHNYNYVDKTKNYKQFDSDITAIGAVGDGLYIGTMTGMWFMTGPTFHDMAISPCVASAVVKNSMLAVPAELINPMARLRPDIPSQTKNAVVCLTSGGIVVGLDGGEAFNLTETTYLLPPAQSAALIFRQQDGVNSLVVSQDSGGDPTNNARFGDHLSAQLIRANGIG